MKRAMFITSGKGGVTKTKFARLLAEMHRKRELPTVFVDADHDVGQFLKHLGIRGADGKVLNPQPPPQDGGVQTIDWHNDVRSRHDLANLLMLGQDVIFDMPGGSLNGLHALDTSAGYMEIVAEAGFEPTFVSMISPWQETWTDAIKIRTWFPNAGHLLVVNHDFGTERDFRRWTASETRAKLIKGGSREIELPLLESGIAADISYLRLSFHDAPLCADIDVMDRGLAKKWLLSATTTIESVGDLLALVSAVPA
ncbi:MAG: hypothetical protein ACYC8W_07755 [Candidatus Tyrphobacter sp.]